MTDKMVDLIGATEGELNMAVVTTVSIMEPPTQDQATRQAQPQGLMSTL
jgi:hypothetical protein